MKPRYRMLSFARNGLVFRGTEPIKPGETMRLPDGRLLLQSRGGSFLVTEALLINRLMLRPVRLGSYERAEVTWDAR